MKQASALWALVGSACACAAQVQVVSRLPWDGPLTAGPNIAFGNVPPENDLWVIEDFRVTQAFELVRLESLGTIPGPLGTRPNAVRAQLYRGFPPLGGTLIAESTGTGRSRIEGGSQLVYIADFGRPLLGPGEYYIAWSADPPASTSFAIAYSTFVDHDIGQGGFQDAWLWNPGGGRGYVDNYRAVPADLGGNGQSGVNFTLFGEFVCVGDLSGSSDPMDLAYGIPDGNLDAADFFYYLDQFTFGVVAVADLTTSSDPNDPGYGVPDGALDAADFFYYLDLFVAGCP
jgi:hypothetical protein